MYEIRVDGELLTMFKKLADAVHEAKRKTKAPYKLIVGLRPDGTEFYRAELS